MFVKDVMSTSVTTVSPETSFKELWTLIFKKHVSSIPVLDNQNKITGMVTREDILKRLYPDFEEFISDYTSASDYDEMEQKVKELLPMKVKSVMNRRVIFTREKTHVMRALSRMIARNVHQLPVLDDNDKVVGILTKGDVFYALFKREVKPEKNAAKNILTKSGKNPTKGKKR